MSYLDFQIGICLLNLHFLGLRTLTVIQDTIDLVKKNQGIDVQFDEKMNDPKVYKLWQSGEYLITFSLIHLIHI